MKIGVLRTASLLLAITGFLGAQTSQSVIWFGSGADTLWSNGTNWLNGVNPGAGNANTFADFGTGATGYNVTVDTSTALGSLFIHPAANKTFVFTTANGSVLNLYQGGLMVATPAAAGTPVTQASFGSGLTLNLAAAQQWFIGGGTTVAGTITGGAAARLTLAGTSTLALSGANTYSGGTTLLAGTVLLGRSSVGTAGAPTSGPLGTGILEVPATAGTVALLADAPAINLQNPIAFPNNPLFVAQTNYFVPGWDPFATSTTSSLPALGLGTTGTANALTLSGPISGQGRLTVQNGDVSLSGTSGFLGLVTVNPGSTLTIAASKAIGSNSALLVLPGATVRLTASALNVFALGEGSLYTDTPAPSGSQLDLAAGSTLSIGYSGAFSGTITGSGAKVVGDGFQLRLSGANTYSGGTTLHSGTLTIGSSSVVSGGTLLSGPAGTGTLRIEAGPAALDPYSEYGYFLVPRILAASDGLSLANPIVLASPLLRLGGDTYFGGSSTWMNGITLSGAISGTGRIEVEGGGTYTLSGDNTFTGGVEVLSGTLVIASPTGAGAGDLVLNPGAIVSMETAAPVLQGLYGYSGEINAELQLKAESVLRVQRGEFSGLISGVSAKIVKEGSDSLKLEGANTYSGGTEVSGGTLYLTGYTTVSGSTVLSGPAGTGKIRLASGATLVASPMYEARLHNAVDLASGSGLGESGTFSGGLTLQGTVTLLDTQSSIRLGGKPLTILSQSATLTASQPGTALTLTGDGRLSLRGATSSNIASIVADGTTVIFDTYASLPSLSVGALANGYVGIGQAFDGQGQNRSFSDLLAKITQPALFAGTIGFEGTTSVTPSPDFIGTIDLGAFTNPGFRGLGTTSQANIGSGATILAPSGGSYRFGGGGGRLGVSATLSGTGAGVIVDSTDLAPLTVVLRGSNTFGGNVSVAYSFLVLDSSGALPAGRSIRLGGSGYASYTPYWNAGSTSAADFIGRLSSDYDSSGIVGFDSATPATASVTVSAPIDLSALPRSVYLGTTTNAAILSGTIKPPPGGALQLAAFQGGTLRITSALTAANGVLSVQIGHPNAALGSASGTVELSGANTYANGTLLDYGTLALGSSTVTGTGGALLSGPLGTGQLSLGGTASLRRATSGSDLFLGNAIVISGSDTALNLEGPADFSLRLGGVISGTGGLNVNTRTVLSGANTFTGGTRIWDSLTIESNAGLGAGYVELAGSSSTLLIGSGAAAPVLNNLSGVDGSSIAAPSGAAITLNNTAKTEFGGSIGGSTASVTKTGSGQITLWGNSSYGGGTTIAAGTIVAGAEQALGSGPVTLAGGSLNFERGTTISNAVNVGAGSRLQGNATINGSVGLGQGAVLAPGNSVGTLTFGSNLTWSGGATFDFELQNPLGLPGFGYDTINVSATLSLTATAANPFIVNLISLNESGAVGPIAFDPTQSYSWQVATAGSMAGFDLTALSLNTSAFSTLAPFNGTFAFSLGTEQNGSTALYLNYTPVPEPRTWALLLLGVAFLARPALRRRRRR